MRCCKWPERGSRRSRFDRDRRRETTAFVASWRQQRTSLATASRGTSQHYGACMTVFSAADRLDPREEHFRIPGPREGLSLFLRFLPAADSRFSPRRAVLYVHGATFPSALSIAHRFRGRDSDGRSCSRPCGTSWRDALNEAGFDVWGLDFYGFGHSDRYSEMDQPPPTTRRFAWRKTRPNSSRPQHASFSHIRDWRNCP